jgi:acetate kinase
MTSAKGGEGGTASSRRVLTINTGSSSLKSAMYSAEDHGSLLQLFSAEISRIGLSGCRFQVKAAHTQASSDQQCDLPDHAAALKMLLEWIDRDPAYRGFDAVGHRVVHGGPLYSTPQLITPQLVRTLEDLVAIDPDHLPQALSAISFISRWHPELPQVGCFDTAFHRSIPKVAAMYALPREFYDEGVLRYGFHGLSYEYVMQQLARIDEVAGDARVVVAHLGNGASMSAIRNGKSIDTSMGYTPTAGLVMGTRCGDVDPGVLIHLLLDRKMTGEQVDEMINKHSGLLGVSGTSEDMRDLLAKQCTDERAREAVELFCYRAKKYLGAYAAALGGLDLLVFTGGIGEHSAEVRSGICRELDFLGIEIDSARNDNNALVISSDKSKVKVRVIKTNEDLMIATHTFDLIA